MAKELIYYHLLRLSVQSLSRVQLFVTPWTAARQASLSITNSQSLPKPLSIESVMPSNHHPLSSPSPPSHGLAYDFLNKTFINSPYILSTAFNIYTVVQVWQVSSSHSYWFFDCFYLLLVLKRSMLQSPSVIMNLPIPFYFCQFFSLYILRLCY